MRIDSTLVRSQFLLWAPLLIALLAAVSNPVEVCAQNPLPTPTQKLQEEMILQRSERNLLSLNLKDANLREVLLLLTRDYEYSLVLEPEVDATISALDLKDVTFEEALEAILSNLGLEYQITGKLLKVRRPGKQTRLFYFNYIAADRTGSREMRLSSRSETGGTSGGVSAGGSAASAGGQSGSGGGSQSENESKVSTVSYSSIWRDLRLGLETIVFGSTGEGAPNVQTEDKGPAGFAAADAGGRRILINPQAGLIMLHAETALIEEAARYIEAVEGSVQRQVLIEAKVVEVSLNKDYQLGVNWSAILNPTNAFSGLLPSARGVTRPSTSFSSGVPINQNVNPSLGQFQYGISNGKVGVVLDALSRQGHLRVLSSPRISTLNNQKAMIRVVREEVFFTLTSQANQSVGSTITTQNIVNQVVPIGVVMDIIPQVGAGGEITLSVNPSISELVEVRTFATGTGAEVSTQPVIDRRDLDTVGTVNSGQTLLIAGIMRERRAEDLRGVPWLMNVPVIGGAFRRTEQSSVRTELVIFITPTVMTGKRIEDLSREEQNHFESLQKNFKLGTVGSVKEGLKGEVTNR